MLTLYRSNENWEYDKNNAIITAIESRRMRYVSWTIYSRMTEQACGNSEVLSRNFHTELRKTMKTWDRQSRAWLDIEVSTSRNYRQVQYPSAMEFVTSREPPTTRGQLPIPVWSCDLSRFPTAPAAPWADSSTDWKGGLSHEQMILLAWPQVRDLLQTWRCTPPPPTEPVQSSYGM